MSGASSYGDCGRNIAGARATSCLMSIWQLKMYFKANALFNNMNVLNPYGNTV